MITISLDLGQLLLLKHIYSPCTLVNQSFLMETYILVAMKFMFLISKDGTDNAVLLSGRLMFFCAAALGIITLTIPTNGSWFAQAYAMVGFGFSAAYAWALTRK